MYVIRLYIMGLDFRYVDDGIDINGGCAYLLQKKREEAIVVVVCV